MSMTRRQTLIAALAACHAAPARAASADLPARLRAGGVVAVLRHALAPGSFDPPGFVLGDCTTQRNLSEDGRAQARAIGAWFATRDLVPARVRSSPWCRCIDTATLAFGSAQPWAALGSPAGTSAAVRSAQLQELHRALAASTARRGRFEVWVTHMFVIADLTGQNTRPGDGVLLAAASDGRIRVVAPLELL